MNLTHNHLSPTYTSFLTAIVDYTFDRLGNAFKPGSVTRVSLIPFLVALVPFLIVVLALIAMRIRALCCSGGKKTPSVADEEKTKEPTAIQMRWRQSLQDVLEMQRGRRERAVLHLFRMAELDEEDGEEGGEGGKGGRTKQTMWGGWWRHIKESHELLAIFLDRRRLTRGVNESLIIFLCSLNSQILGVTIFYFLHACYELNSVFDEDSISLNK